MELTYRDNVTSQWSPIMSRGRQNRDRPKIYAPYEPGPPGESVEQFFARVRSNVGEKHSFLLDPPMNNESSVLRCDHDSNRSLAHDSRSPSLGSLLDDVSRYGLAQSPRQAVYTQSPPTQTSNDHLNYPSDAIDNMTDEALGAFALQVASGHPDAMPPASRSAESKANRSTHRTLSKYVADHFKPALSWCKGRSYAQSGTRSQVSKGLDAGSKWSLSIFGRTLSRAGSHIKDMWNDNRGRYLGVNLEDCRHPFRRGKEHRERANRGYSDISRTTSTNAHSQTTRRSSPRPSNPGFLGRTSANPNACSTDALSLHPDSQLPNDPGTVTFPPCLAGREPSDGDGCDLSAGSVGWDARKFFSNDKNQAVFKDTD